MYFTQEDYKKIENWLHRNSVKDSEFQEALPFTGTEFVTVVQDGHNRKVNIQEFINQLYKHGVEDFLNVTNTYRANNITLKEAIRLIPAEARKEGQVITFLNTDGNWEIYQFTGKLNQWNNTTLWNNPFDWEKLIVDSILPDEEDLTKSAPDAKGNAYLSLKDRKYEPDKYSGLGRKILRRRVVEIEDPIYGTQEKNLLLQADFAEDNTVYVVRYDFTLNGQDITLPDNSYIEYEGGSISDGNIIDRAGGLNRVVLKKNIINGKNILTQDMVSIPNTIYEIRYDFTLGENITVPANCVLEFDGGSLNDGEINLTAGNIKANNYCFNNISFVGYLDFINQITVPTNNAKEFVETILALKSLDSTYPTVLNFSANIPYVWDGVLRINKKQVTLTGGGVIEGHIQLGFSENEVDEIGDWGYSPSTSCNFIVSNLTFSKYNVIGATDDASVNNYVNNAVLRTGTNPNYVYNYDNIAISIRFVSGLTIQNCNFHYVPFAIVEVSSPVTQNGFLYWHRVEQLNKIIIDCCEFKCKTAFHLEGNTTGYYAPLNGDVHIARSNFYCINDHILAKDMDGLRLMHNTFYTTNSGYTHINCINSSQVEIENNIFHGELIARSINLDNVGITVISGNLFFAIGTSLMPTDKNKAYCIYIHNTGGAQSMATADILNNSFSNVEKLPIYIDAKSGAYNINGNTLSANYNDSNLSKRSLYNIIYNNGLLQKFINSATQSRLRDYTPFLNVRIDAIQDYFSSSHEYAIQKNRKKIRCAMTSPRKTGNVDFFDVTVSSVMKYKPILILYGLWYKDKAQFYFNSVYFDIDITVTGNDTKEKIVSYITAIKNAIESLFSDEYNFLIVGRCLYIVGKNNDINYVSPFYDVDSSVDVLYENMGYRIIIKDTDGKNFQPVANDWNNYGIMDADDNGKIYTIGDKTFTLKTTKIENSHLTYNFKYPVSIRDGGLYLMYIYNDICVAYYVENNITSQEHNNIINQIISLCYSDLGTLTDNSFELTETATAYTFKNYGDVAVYATINSSSKVCDAILLTDDGVEYNPQTNTYNDSGLYANKPAAPKVGFKYLATDRGTAGVGLPIYYTGNNTTPWVDATGAPV